MLSTSSRFTAVVFVFGFLSVGCVDEDVSPHEVTAEIPASADAVFLMPLSNTESNSNDMAFLAAIPAATQRNGGKPAIIGIESSGDLAEGVEDYLNRFGPKEAVVINREGLTIPHAEKTIHLEAATPSALSLLLAQTYWTESQRAVMVAADDYPGALLGASVAARLGSPLLIVDSNWDEMQSPLDALKVQETLYISLDESAQAPSVDVLFLDGVPAVLKWLKDNSVTVDYIALTNPADREMGRAQKLSLVAPILSARRDGITLPMTLSIPTEPLTDRVDAAPLNFLKTSYATLGRHPEHVALVGRFDSLPVFRGPSIFDNPLSEQPVSDLPYGEVDSDEFLDIGLGRIVSDTVQEATVLASRISTYRELMNGDWENNFMEAGLWGFDELRFLFTNVGFETSSLLTVPEIRLKSSFEVSAILHKDHSNCMILGGAFDTTTSGLLAPAIVSSRGCSVGGIDQAGDSEPTIVNHLLGKGAVAFLGATRNSIAENTLIEVSFWNHVLAGEPLGTAFKSGINDMMVHWLDDDRGAGVRYSIDIEILYGDPAMQYHVPSAPQSKPAHVRVEESTVTVVPPEEWKLVQFLPSQLAEWNYDDDLFMYVGAGASPRTYWSGSHDSEDLYFGVNVPLTNDVSSVKQLSTHASPLGWGEGFYVDSHQDGSRSLLWRVRLLDYDMATGEITDQLQEARYELEP